MIKFLRIAVVTSIVLTSTLTFAPSFASNNDCVVGTNVPFVSPSQAIAGIFGDKIAHEFETKNIHVLEVDKRFSPGGRSDVDFPQVIVFKIDPKKTLTHTQVAETIFAASQLTNDLLAAVHKETKSYSLSYKNAALEVLQDHKKVAAYRIIENNNSLTFQAY